MQQSLHPFSEYRTDRGRRLRGGLVLGLQRMMTCWHQQNGNAHVVQKAENTTTGEGRAFESVLSAEALSGDR